MPATITSLLLVWVCLANNGEGQSLPRPALTSASLSRTLVVAGSTGRDLTVRPGRHDDRPFWTISEADNDEEQDDSSDDDSIPSGFVWSPTTGRDRSHASPIHVDRSIVHLSPRSPLLRC